MDSKADVARSPQAVWRRVAGHAGVAALAAMAVFGVRHVTAGRVVADGGVSGVQPAASARHPAPPREIQAPLELAGLDDGAVARLAEAEPMRVMAAIDRVKDWQEALRLAKLCTRAVAGPDFDLLVSWARRQKDPKLAATIFKELIPRWVREDMPGCLAFAHDLGADDFSMNAKASLLGSLSCRLGVEMLAQLPAEQQAQLLHQSYARLASRNPEGALDLLAKLPASDGRRETLTGLVDKWAGEGDVYHVPDPQGAVNRIQQIPDEPLRDEGLRAAVAAWCRNNPPGAARWAENLPDGSGKDAAIQGLVQFFAAKDPDRALTWAQRIGDSALREGALKKLQTP